MINILVVFIFLYFSFGPQYTTANYAVLVKAHDKFCFHEELKAGTKMLVRFQVAKGGHKDIDIRITGPDNENIVIDDYQHDGELKITGYMDGRYTYCFGNAMSRVTDKLVIFNVETGEAPSNPDENEDRHKTLARMIGQLKNDIDITWHEQQLIKYKAQDHTATAEDTRFQVALWTFFEFVMLMAMSSFQVYYFKRCFEVKTYV